MHVSELHWILDRLSLRSTCVNVKIVEKEIVGHATTIYY